MELKEYLEALKRCPDEILSDGSDTDYSRLTREFGIYDNWPILLGQPIEAFLMAFDHPQLSFLGTREDDSMVMARAVYNYNPGTVFVQVWDQIHCCYGSALLRSDEHRRRIEEDYQTAITLHPYQERKMENVHWTKPMAEVIQIFGQYALENNVALCFPKSRGWDNLDDLSRIVYHS